MLSHIPLHQSHSASLSMLSEDSRGWPWNDWQEKGFWKLKMLPQKHQCWNMLSLTRIYHLRQCKLTNVGNCPSARCLPNGLCFLITTELRPVCSDWKKKCLQLIFGFEHFQGDVYGLKSIKIQIDHKSLVLILQKLTCKALPRLQKMLMKWQHFSLNVKHRHNKANSYKRCAFKRAYK